MVDDGIVLRIDGSKEDLGLPSFKKLRKYKCFGISFDDAVQEMRDDCLNRGLNPCSILPGQEVLEEEKETDEEEKETDEEENETDEEENEEDTENFEEFEESKGSKSKDKGKSNESGKESVNI